jgi:hypothetical protein
MCVRSLGPLRTERFLWYANRLAAHTYTLGETRMSIDRGYESVKLFIELSGSTDRPGARSHACERAILGVEWLSQLEMPLNGVAINSHAVFLTE